MNTALYYPNTSVTSTSLLKTALLLWDKLEVIVPDEHFSLTPPDEGRLSKVERRTFAEALEIVCSPIVPTESEKNATHVKIESLLEGGLPAKYLFEPDSASYLIYASKFGGKTWKLLAQHQLVGKSIAIPKGKKTYHDHPLKPQLGLMLMTMLADVCAGGTARKVTDAAYANSANSAYFTRLEGGELDQKSQQHETLVVETFAPALPIADVTLKQLVALRRNESVFLNELRENYRKEVDAFILRLAGQVQTARDYNRIWREFHDKMSDRLDALNGMLGRQNMLQGTTLLETLAPGFGTAATMILTKASLMSAVVAGLSIFTAATLFKTIGSIPANREKREDLMRKNPASWLYLAKKRPPSYKR